MPKSDSSRGTSTTADVGKTGRRRRSKKDVEPAEELRQQQCHLEAEQAAEREIAEELLVQLAAVRAAAAVDVAQQQKAAAQAAAAVAQSQKAATPAACEGEKNDRLSRKTLRQRFQNRGTRNRESCLLGQRSWCINRRSRHQLSWRRRRIHRRSWRRDV